MIQKAMLDVLEPKDEREMQRIGRQREARNRGMGIQLPTLHTTLIETPQELAKVTQEAKSIAEMCKRAEKASE